jgi:hypothetical protein
MDTYVEQYQATHGGVTLHTWRDMPGGKKENFSMTGVSGTPVASWFRTNSARSTSPLSVTFRRALSVVGLKGLIAGVGCTEAPACRRCNRGA